MFFKKKKKIVNVEGMTCEHCCKKIENTLETLADIIKVKVNLNKKQIYITYENTIDEILIQNKIEELGYTVTGIKEQS